MSKFPRMYHLPWSPGGTNDDKRLTSVDSLLGRPLVITEKMDGSNVCLTHDQVFARSHSGPPAHPSFDWLKSLHAGARYAIPPGISVFAEYLYAVHSIAYDALPDYVMVIAVRDDSSGLWLGWEDTVDQADALGLMAVPLIAGPVTFATADELAAATTEWANQPGYYGTREGLVVRSAAPVRNFAGSFAKWVRAGHVQTDQHWSHGPVRRQILQAT